ncbi:nucleotidyltransferase domain-containing protein [Stackebrandtia soli]|uniref:nucleotidyltransferase domain-containing protein n=1 Tax=Stackebrandtia soli TaxID=1892856 RepID=UPI0039E91899
MEYPTLVARLRDTLAADSRVAGIWLVGSRGRGESDEHSDVDLLVAAASDDVDKLSGSVIDLVSAAFPLVYSQQLGAAPIFNFITKEWLRFDISLCGTEALSRYRRDGAQLVHGSDDLDALLSDATHELGADAATVERLTIEFMRVLGLLPVVVGRDDIATGVSGAALVRNLLIELMKQDAVVVDRGGMLSARRVLPDRHYEQLRALPPLHSDSGSVVAYNVTCARLFFPLSRMLYGQCGLAWPDGMHVALAEHLRATLDIELIS